MPTYSILQRKLYRLSRNLSPETLHYSSWESKITISNHSIHCHNVISKKQVPSYFSFSMFLSLYPGKGKGCLHSGNPWDALAMSRNKTISPIPMNENDGKQMGLSDNKQMKFFRSKKLKGYLVFHVILSTSMQIITNQQSSWH